jgi:heterodisulfide reductase subunit D
MELRLWRNGFWRISRGMQSKSSGNRFYRVRELMEIEACTNCSLCADVCPAVSASRDGQLSGVYRLRELKRIQRWRTGLFNLLSRIFDGGKLSRERLKGYGNTVFRCTLCGRCQEVCPVGIRLRGLWLILRQDLAHSGAYPKEIEVIRDNLEKSHNVFAEESDERADWVDNLRDIPEHRFIRDRAEVVYFTGCVSSYFPMAQRIPMALVEILDIAGVSFTLLGEDEWCCGFPLLGAGLGEQIRDIIAHNIEVVRKRGAKRVIFACPTCYQMWREYYPPEVDIEHVTGFLFKLLREGRIPLGEVSMTVTYHDPCDLGRGAQIFEEPREIIRSIPGIEMVELDRNRENCQCCGGGGNLEMIDARLSSEIARQKIDEVVRTGADAVITSCQQCVRTMNTFVRRNRMTLEVMDIAQLLLRSIKGKL